MLAVDAFNSFELAEVKGVNVLIIEPDVDYVEIVRVLLNDNFDMQFANTAEEGLALLKNTEFSLIIVNSSLNDKENDQNLIDSIRTVTAAPVIALVEMQDEENSSNLVFDGADYVLAKPFTPRRLRAAITAVLRRSELGGNETSDPVLPETLTSGGLKLSLGRLEVLLNGKKISLSAREFSLFQFLMSNANRAFTREELASQAWGWAKGGEMRAVDSAIKRLRQKIEEDTRNPHYILTERNIGYRFNANGSNSK
ncbi:MAG TPA: response regulator transcription factor [Chloroflexia bacterium]|nr:response regulator transcription factor [Chloroflexia bacterium]